MAVRLGGWRLAGAVAAVLVCAGLLVLPQVLRPFGLYLLSLWAVTAIAAMGLNLTLGYAGQISLAQGAFVGIGAYTVGLLTMAGWPFFVALPLAGLLCFAVGWVLGFPALRVQHHYLAFVTLAFSTLVFLLLRNEEWLTNGTYGLNGIPRPSFLGLSLSAAVPYTYFCLAMMALVAAALGWLVRSPWGRAFVALRENPIRAMSLGVDTRRYTLMAFALGSAVGGIAGGLYAALVQFIEPNAFALGLSLKYLLMVLVGGAGYWLGPFIGAAIDILLPEWLRFTQGYYLLVYASLVMILMMICPQGLLGLVDRIRAGRRQRRAAAARPGRPVDTAGVPE